ncbi:MAG: hypothetical protein JNM68_00415, partial [Dinghuibacter sp.]|nr:hypothetical protein [Dinghuibacter sp.]
VTLTLPLAWLLLSLRNAQVAAHYHRLSSLTKIIILAGILSMLFFLLYIRSPQPVILIQ